MVLAAGRGVRLRPLTDERPKPLLPLANLSLLHFPLLLLRGAGILDVTLNLHHLGDQIRETLGDGSALGMRLRYSEERPRLLGTGGGIKRARASLDGGPFVVVNGDTLVDADLPGAIAAHHRAGGIATMVLADATPGTDFGVVRVDAEMRVRDIAGRTGFQGEGRDGHFCGIHVIEPRLFDRMPDEEVFCINADVYPRLIAAGERVTGCFLARAFHDVGTPARYLETVDAIVTGRLAPAYAADALPPRDPAFRIGPGNLWIHDTARIDPGARVEGPAYVGARAAIEARAHVGPGAYLGEESRVGAGARVTRAILWEGAAAGPGEKIEGGIVTRKSRVMV
jgi:NDP-sugar pyrophosphorylase family protein